jgi:hypothetical protein
MEGNEVVGKEQDEEMLHLQGSHSEVIKAFRSQLVEWLQKDGEDTRDEEELEDRELDALLLKVVDVQFESN